MRRFGTGLILLVMSACAPTATDPELTPEADLPADQIISGTEFLTADTRALQADSFANPGFLWVDRGAGLFRAVPESGPACQSCHENGLGGVATRYPAIDAASGNLLNLEGRINQCRIDHQDLSPLPYESEDLLALTAYVANQSYGMPIAVDTTGPAAEYLAVGERYFRTRRGQFNLSCQQCHTETWGKQLRGDTISQGHGNGFPAYRLEWQSLGSLQRRLRDCDTGVRAEPLPYGDPLYVAVELYLAARAQGLDMESPAVRR